MTGPANIDAATRSRTRPVVLSLLGAYWPGNDASGPNQSYKGMASALSDEFEFRLIARDRPFGAPAPLTQDRGWVDLRFAKGRFIEVGRWTAKDLGAVIRQTPHDILWLNGFFDREFTLNALMQRRLGAIPRRPALLSVRGEMAPGALGLKARQKQLYLRYGRRLGLLNGVVLHATSAAEKNDIQSALGSNAGTAVAANVRALMPRPERALPAEGAPLNIVFAGRVARVKNLDVALKALALVTVPVKLSICAPIEEADYWQECSGLIAQLPHQIEVQMLGEVSNGGVLSALASADLFLLPTKGENFGHAIFEALACGVPVLISDQTPWRGLEAQSAGWDVPLGDPGRFSQIIGRLAAMPPGERARLRDGARALAERYAAANEALAQTRTMLNGCLNIPAAGQADPVEMPA